MALHSGQVSITSFLVWHNSEKALLLWSYPILIHGCLNLRSMENFCSHFMLYSVIKILIISLKELWRTFLAASLWYNISLMECSWVPVSLSSISSHFTDVPLVFSHMALCLMPWLNSDRFHLLHFLCLGHQLCYQREVSDYSNIISPW